MKTYLRYLPSSSVGGPCTGHLALEGAVLVTAVNDNVLVRDSETLAAKCAFTLGGKFPLSTGEEVYQPSPVTTLFVKQDYIYAGYKNGVCRIFSLDQMPDENTRSEICADPSKRLICGAPVVQEPLNQFKGHTSAVQVIRYRDTDQLLATGASDTDIVLWDATYISEVRGTARLRGHSGPIYDLIFFGDFLLSVSQDCSLRVWDVGTNRCVDVIDVLSSPLYTIVPILENVIIVAGDGPDVGIVWLSNKKYDLSGWNKMFENKEISVSEPNSVASIMAKLPRHNPKKAVRGGTVSNDGIVYFWGQMNGIEILKCRQATETKKMMIKKLKKQAKRSVLVQDWEVGTVKVESLTEEELAEQKERIRVQFEELMANELIKADKIVKAPYFEPGSAMASLFFSTLIYSLDPITFPTKVSSVVYPFVCLKNSSILSLDPKYDTTILRAAVKSKQATSKRVTPEKVITINKKKISDEICASVLETEKQKEQYEILLETNHEGGVRALAVSKDQRWIATSGLSSVTIFSLSMLTVTEPVRISNVRALLFSNCSKYLIAATIQGVLILIEVITGRVLDITKSATGCIHDLVYCKRGIAACGAFSEVFFFNIDSGSFKISQYRECISDHLENVSYDELDKFIATIGYECPDTILSLSEEATALDVYDNLLAVALVADRVEVFFLDSLNLANSYYGHGCPANSVAFSDDGQMLALAGADRRVTVISAKFGYRLFSHKEHTSVVTNVAFIPLTHYVISTSLTGELLFYDADENSHIQLINAHSGPIKKLALGQDGGFIFTAGTDQSLRVWARSNQQCIPSLDKRDHDDYNGELLREDIGHQVLAEEVSIADRPSRRDFHNIQFVEDLIVALDAAKVAFESKDINQITTEPKEVEVASSIEQEEVENIDINVQPVLHEEDLISDSSDEDIVVFDSPIPTKSSFVESKSPTLPSTPSSYEKIESLDLFDTREKSEVDITMKDTKETISLSDFDNISDVHSSDEAYFLKLGPDSEIESSSADEIEESNVEENEVNDYCVVNDIPFEEVYISDDNDAKIPSIYKCPMVKQDYIESSTYSEAQKECYTQLWLKLREVKRDDMVEMLVILPQSYCSQLLEILGHLILGTHALHPEFENLGVLLEQLLYTHYRNILSSSTEKSIAHKIISVYRKKFKIRRRVIINTLVAVERTLQEN